MEKAVREAKVHTSWIDENQAYGKAVTRFVERSLRGRTAARFLAAFIPLQRRLAHIGMMNSLAQLVLKLASPGVPDFYQGSELWNLDLVDPDNRRPVDYELRSRLLDTLEPLLTRVEAGEPAESEVAGLAVAWHDARIKLFVTSCGLRYRRRHPDLVLEGGYVPLTCAGTAREHVVAFIRPHGSDALLCGVPRLTAQNPDWQSTRISLPSDWSGAGFRHVFTGARIDVVRDGPDSWLRAADLFRSIPVALLAAE
jgi:(1->4)-alpha-D-glucan 1-alpha-D-glucosylmutase